MANIIEQSFLKAAADDEVVRLIQYAKYDRYYHNENQLQLPQKFIDELQQVGIKSNYCAPVVDAYVARLRFKGLSGGDKEATKKVADVWGYNRMDKKFIQLNRIAAKKGDAYAIVWPDTPEHITIQVNPPELVTPITNSVGEVVAYKKQWNVYDSENNILYVRRDVFYTDRIEMYYSKEDTQGWLPYVDEKGNSTYPNPYGVLPVVHFANKVDEGVFGASELDNAIPIQQDINRLIMDMLMAAGYLGFGQIYITGVTKNEIDNNNPNGLNRNPGSGWIIPRAEAKVGKLGADNLTSLIDAINNSVERLATITRTPLYYLQAKASMQSGLALSILEGPLADKVAEAQINFGNSYEDINRLVLLMQGVNDPPEVGISWYPALPYGKAKEDIQMWVAGALSLQQLLRNQGYTDDQIERIMQEIQQEENNRMQAVLQQQAGK